MIIYLNDQYVDKGKAHVSVFDRGLLFSESVYEVIPYINGRCIGLEPHLQRLTNSLQSIHIPSTLTTENWKSIFKTLLQRNNLQDTDVQFYIQITSGAYAKRDHQRPLTVNPTVIAYCQPLIKEKQKRYQQGLHVITLEDSRRRDCYIKANGLLPNSLALQAANDAQADDVIFIRDNHALESSSSNLFVIHNNQLITPPATPHILNGITRQTLLQLAQKEGIDTQERNIHQDELHQAQAVWITGSLKGIVPILSIDKQPITSNTHPLYSRIQSLYQQFTNHCPQLFAHKEIHG